MTVFLLSGWISYDGKYTMGVYASYLDAMAAWELYVENHPNHSFEGHYIDEIEVGAEADVQW